jgi:hypothetical protein
MKPREYQLAIIEQARKILLLRRVVYLAMEMRTGKTITSLMLAKEFGNNILLVTKKKAIDGIQKDCDALGINATIINYESIHKVKSDNVFDVMIVDEVHSLGAFPKPSLRAVNLRDVKRKYTILMSGTPTPETPSQLYHQFWICKEASPFMQWSSFYAWAKEFVNIKKKRVSHSQSVNDYSECNLEKVNIYIDPIFVRYRQVDAGFDVDNFVIKKHYVTPPEVITKTVKILKRDKVIEGKAGILLADTPVKLMSKEHQLWSGTVLLEDNIPITLSDYKVRYILENFRHKKAVVFHKFQQEGELLNAVAPSSWRVLQIQAGSAGLTLSDYDCVVYMTLDFSCVNYTQSMQRINYLGRDENPIHFIMAKGGMDEEILKTLEKKEDYSLKIYERNSL